MHNNYIKIRNNNFILETTDKIIIEFPYFLGKISPFFKHLLSYEKIYQGKYVFPTIFPSFILEFIKKCIDILPKVAYKNGTKIKTENDIDKETVFIHKELFVEITTSFSNILNHSNFFISKIIEATTYFFLDQLLNVFLDIVAKKNLQPTL